MASSIPVKSVAVEAFSSLGEPAVAKGFAGIKEGAIGKLFHTKFGCFHSGLPVFDGKHMIVSW